MINNVSFGKTYLVTTEDNSEQSFNRFKGFCNVKSEMVGKTIHSEPSHFYSKYKMCTLDVPECMERGVEDYCKSQGIKFSTLI